VHGPAPLAEVTDAADCRRRRDGRLVRALTLPLKTSEWFDLPAPRCSRASNLAAHGGRAGAAETGHGRRPGSHSLALVPLGPLRDPGGVVGRARDRGRAHHDMLAHDDRFWRECGHTGLLSFADARGGRSAAERGEGEIPGFWGGVEGWLSRVARARARMTGARAFPEGGAARPAGWLAVIAVVGWVCSILRALSDLVRGGRRNPLGCSYFPLAGRCCCPNCGPHRSRCGVLGGR
jgi:hypothetical protein